MVATLFSSAELMECHGLSAAPILMRLDEIISLKEAAHRARRTVKVTTRLCRDFRICRQTVPGAPLEISAPALEMVLHADAEALDLLRQGKRDHPRVRMYFHHLGLLE